MIDRCRSSSPNLTNVRAVGPFQSSGCLPSSSHSRFSKPSAADALPRLEGCDAELLTTDPRAAQPDDTSVHWPGARRLRPGELCPLRTAGQPGSGLGGVHHFTRRGSLPCPCEGSAAATSSLRERPQFLTIDGRCPARPSAILAPRSRADRVSGAASTPAPARSLSFGVAPSQRAHRPFRCSWHIK